MVVFAKLLAACFSVFYSSVLFAVLTLKSIRFLFHTGNWASNRRPARDKPVYLVGAWRGATAGNEKEEVVGSTTAGKM